MDNEKQSGSEIQSSNQEPQKEATTDDINSSEGEPDLDSHKESAESLSSISPPTSPSTVNSNNSETPGYSGDCLTERMPRQVIQKGRKPPGESWLTHAVQFDVVVHG